MTKKFAPGDPNNDDFLRHLDDHNDPPQKRPAELDREIEEIIASGPTSPNSTWVERGQPDIQLYRSPSGKSKVVGSPNGAKKPRKKKGAAPRQTERQRLEEAVADAKAAVRSASKNSKENIDRSLFANLKNARLALGRSISLDLGHAPLVQGFAFECPRCGASGAFDVSPEGSIFTDACTGSQAAAQIAYRAKL